jgi:hypothetical protein
MHGTGCRKKKKVGRWARTKQVEEEREGNKILEFDFDRF